MRPDTGRGWDGRASSASVTRAFQGMRICSASPSHGPRSLALAPVVSLNTSLATSSSSQDDSGLGSALGSATLPLCSSFSQLACSEPLNGDVGERENRDGAGAAGACGSQSQSPRANLGPMALGMTTHRNVPRISGGATVNSGTKRHGEWAAGHIVQPSRHPSDPKPLFRQEELVDSDFERLGVLGHGSYSTVYLARHLPSAQLVALKAISRKQLRHAGLEKQCQWEINVHRRLRHPNIVQLLSYYVTTREIFLVLEYCRRGTLATRISTTEGGYLDEARAIRLTRQTARAVAHLHAHGIAHRDLKLENVLLDHHGLAKLADFGWSKQVNTALKPKPGHAGVVATPEEHCATSIHVAQPRPGHVASSVKPAVPADVAKRNLAARAKVSQLLQLAGKQQENSKLCSKVNGACGGDGVSSLNRRATPTPKRTPQRPWEREQYADVLAPQGTKSPAVSTSHLRATAIAAVAPSPEPHRLTSARQQAEVTRLNAFHGTDSAAAVSPARAQSPRPLFPTSATPQPMAALDAGCGGGDERAVNLPPSDVCELSGSAFRTPNPQRTDKRERSAGFTHFYPSEESSSKSDRRSGSGIAGAGARYSVIGEAADSGGPRHIELTAEKPPRGGDMHGVSKSPMSPVAWPALQGLSPAPVLSGGPADSGDVVESGCVNGPSDAASALHFDEDTFQGTRSDLELCRRDLVRGPTEEMPEEPAMGTVVDCSARVSHSLRSSSSSPAKDDRGRLTVCGTLDYLSPEMLQGLPHTSQTDVWSLGVMVAEMLTGTAPFYHPSPAATVDAIRSGVPSFSRPLPPKAAELILQMLRKNPDERPTMSDVLKHEWLAKKHRPATVPALRKASRRQER